MKRIKWIVFLLCMWGASCGHSDEPAAEQFLFTDFHYLDLGDDRSSVYTDFRLANATSGTVDFSVFVPGSDEAAGRVCRPCEAFVYSVKGNKVQSLAEVFTAIQAIFKDSETGQRVRISYAPEEPEGGPVSDPGRWSEKRSDARHIRNTYVFTEADYRYALAHGTVY